MRKLIYIPIVHNLADMGSAGAELSLQGEKKYGKEKWNEHLISVDKSWDDINLIIHNKLNLRYDNVKIYQDGLLVVDEIGLKIIEDVASKGSINYQIIYYLISLGCKLEQAESKELLIDEYHLTKNILESNTPMNKLKANVIYQILADKLLNDRDEHIANQINITLKDDEIGIAFFGAVHSIIDKLNSDIIVDIIQLFKDEISLNLTSL